MEKKNALCVIEKNMATFFSKNIQNVTIVISKEL